MHVTFLSPTKACFKLVLYQEVCRQLYFETRKPVRAPHGIAAAPALAAMAFGTHLLHIVYMHERIDMFPSKILGRKHALHITLSKMPSDGQSQRVSYMMQISTRIVRFLAQ